MSRSTGQAPRALEITNSWLYRGIGVLACLAFIALPLLVAFALPDSHNGWLVPMTVVGAGLSAGGAYLALPRRILVTQDGVSMSGAFGRTMTAEREGLRYEIYEPSPPWLSVVGRDDRYVPVTSADERTVIDAAETFSTKSLANLVGHLHELGVPGELVSSGGARHQIDLQTGTTHLVTRGISRRQEKVVYLALAAILGGATLYILVRLFGG